MTIGGVRSRAWRSDAISPPTPPGTAAAAGWVAWWVTGSAAICGAERGRIARECHPVAVHDDLTPADAPRAGPIDEPNLAGAGKRRLEWCRVLADEPHRREPAGPGRKAQSGRLDGEGECTTAGRQGQARRESIAGDLALGLHLG